MIGWIITAQYEPKQGDQVPTALGLGWQSIRALRLSEKNILTNIGAEYFGGPYCELVKISFAGNPCHMVIHEEGLLRNLPINRLASFLYNRRFTSIRGTAIILDGELT